MKKLNEQAIEEIIIKERNDTITKNELQMFKYKIDNLERSIKSFYLKLILSISLEIILIFLILILIVS